MKRNNLTVLKMRSNAQSINQVTDLVAQVSEKLRLTPDTFGNVLVSLTEAVNNAIIHGNKQDESKYVEVMMQQKADKLSVTVKDQGKGFDYSSVADPTEAANLCRCGGRGVFLMRQLSQNCKFSENGRVVNMEFDI
jgi:serine/threonine-protein kinase RsbW